MSTASRPVLSGQRWAYFWVIAGFAWPSSSETFSSETPFCTSRDANAYQQSFATNQAFDMQQDPHGDRQLQVDGLVADLEGRAAMILGLHGGSL